MRQVGTTPHDGGRVPRESRKFPPMWMAITAILLIAAGVTFVVYRHAWVCDDSFITFRYVSNVHGGFGPVFNVGERVQGYTHPLWFVLLVAGSLIIRDPLILSIAYGLLFTFLNVAVLGLSFLRAGGHRYGAMGWTALFAVVCVFNQPWVTFQTSGLENSLSHFLLTLVLIELLPRQPWRPFPLILLLCLLCLSRPDFVVFTAPLVPWIVSRLRTSRGLVVALLGVLPALAWLLFAWLYYGSVLPNTASAKLGIFPDLLAAMRQGSIYAADFIQHFPSSVGAGCFLFVAGLWRARSLPPFLCAAGVLAYLAWVVGVGGDFMRGRLLLPVLVAGSVFGLVQLAGRRDDTRPWSSRRVLSACALGCALGILQWVAPRDEVSNNRGIVDEWAYYPGYRLSFYLREGRVVSPWLDLRWADTFREYADQHGAITIHDRNPGALGFLAGPKVAVIDTLGLTDAFIARLPKQYLLSRLPRPGHPDKYVPLSYLAGRGDIMIVPNWPERLRVGDPSLRVAPAEFRDEAVLVRLPDHLGFPVPVRRMVDGEPQ